MAEDLGRVLLVGGTGMLTGLAEWLAPRATPLVLAARNPLELAAKLGADPVAINWNDDETLTPLLDRRFDLVISWLHKEGLWLTDLLEALLVPGGRSVRVHGSASVERTHRDAYDPAPRPDIKRQTAVLAWDENRGSKRWLTHTQISDGVIQLVQTPDEPHLIIGEFLYD